ncbi:hypothetical protein LINPERPRIM_LOCUS29581 [Linum perenne]
MLWKCLKSKSSLDEIGRLKFVKDTERRTNGLTSSLTLVFGFLLDVTRSRPRSLVLAIFFLVIILVSTNLEQLF